MAKTANALLNTHYSKNMIQDPKYTEKMDGIKDELDAVEVAIRVIKSVRVERDLKTGQKINPRYRAQDFGRLIYARSSLQAKIAREQFA